jgi:thiol-disulfide isomerase/thioredoxin
MLSSDSSLYIGGRIRRVAPHQLNDMCGLARTIAVVFIATLLVSCGRRTAGTRPAVGSVVGSVQTVDVDGARVDIGARTEGPTLVNLWATWCGPCLEEIPELDMVQRESHDVRVIGIAVEEAATETLRSFRDERRIGYPIVRETPDTRRLFPSEALPTSYFVNSKGEIRFIFEGPLTAPEIRVLLAATGDDLERVAREVARAVPDIDPSALVGWSDVFVRRLANDRCTCGCGMTLMQCRIYDSSCKTSQGIVARILKDAR